VGESILVRMHEPLVPIGTFARLCRLSVKQLRHYDELGLLRPATVDPHSGYRYYRRDQARDALSIGLLRSLDVPLASIARVLAGDEVTAALGEVRDRLEAELVRRRRTLATLDRMLSDGLPAVEVLVVAEREHRVAVVRDVAAPERIGEVTSACIARLLDALARAGRELRPPLIALFPLDFDQSIGITATAEVDDEVPGTELAVLPGGRFASATHLGPYDHISLTAHALLAWCADRGHSPVEPLREVYLTDPRTTAPEQLVTHLMIRLDDEQ
jgi:DNA-binding transcriptional MerR regulator